VITAAIVSLSTKLTRHCLDSNVTGMLRLVSNNCLIYSLDMSTDTFCLEITRLKQLEYLIRTQQIDKNFSGGSNAIYATKLKGSFIIDLDERADHRGFCSHFAEECANHGSNKMLCSVTSKKRAR